MRNHDQGNNSNIIGMLLMNQEIRKKNRLSKLLLKKKDLLNRLRPRNSLSKRRLRDLLSRLKPRGSLSKPRPRGLLKLSFSWKQLRHSGSKKSKKRKLLESLPLKPPPRQSKNVLKLKKLRLSASLLKRLPLRQSAFNKKLPRRHALLRTNRRRKRREL